MNVVRIEGRAAARPDAATPAERARLLMQEARFAAIEHLETLEAAIKVVRDLSTEVLQSGDLYPVGVRDLAAHLAEDLLWRGKSLEALAARERAGRLAR